MKRMAVAEFHAACKAQSPSSDLVVFVCPMCDTKQTVRDLIAAGAGATIDEVERYIGFSCVGRWMGAGAPPRRPNGRPCNWTLGGLFKTNKLEVEMADGRVLPLFELATPEDAEAYRKSKGW